MFLIYRSLDGLQQYYNSSREEDGKGENLCPLRKDVPFRGEYKHMLMWLEKNKKWTVMRQAGLEKKRKRKDKGKKEVIKEK